MKAALLVSVCIFYSIGLLAQQANGNVFNYHKADSVAALYSNHSLHNVSDLVTKLTTPFTTDYEKFRALYTWICLNIEYDYPGFVKNKRMREKLKADRAALATWNKEFSMRMFKKLLTDKQTICTGYAYLVKTMAEQAGFNCVMIDGYGRSAKTNIGGTGFLNHTWNAIQLDSVWYLCDATWSSGGMDMQKLEFIKKYDAGYFLTDPDVFIRSHYPQDTTWTLTNKNPTRQEFLNRPLVYRGACQYNLSELIPETFTLTATKGIPVSFCFNKPEAAIKLVTLQINTALKTPAVIETNGLNCINHTFKAKGTYQVNVLLNAQYVFSYEVRVK